MRKSLPKQAAASLCIAFLLGPLSANAEGLAGYAENLCIESGIPLEQCTLMPVDSGASVSKETAVSSGTAGPTSAKRTKAETLTEHGRALCKEQGVSIEDCLALPAELRVTEQPAEIVAPKRVRPVPIPVKAYQPPKLQYARKVVRKPVPKAYAYVPPPPTYVPPPPTYTPPPPTYTPPPPPYPVPIYDPAPDIPYAAQIEGYQTETLYYPPPPIDYLPPPRERLRGQFLYEAPIVEHYGPPPREYRERVRHLRPDFSEREHVYYSDRLYVAPKGPRCFRSVRYSAPPSYRYVACD